MYKSIHIYGNIETEMHCYSCENCVCECIKF